MGKDRAPTLEDFPHLPYIQAMIKECHRWRPVVPLAVPHGTIEDISVSQSSRDVEYTSLLLDYSLLQQYRGFRIPKGTTIFVNTWGISHDPDVYERPEDFWPDRWILNEFGAKPGADTSDRRNNIWFGSGRRFCPGFHLASNSLVRMVIYGIKFELTVMA